MSRFCLISLLILIGASACQGPSDLTQLPPYPEEFQRAWFGAMNDVSKGDLEPAYTGFLACLALEPEDVSVLFQLGKIELQQGKPQDALIHFNAALEQQPSEDLWMMDFRGLAALESGNLDLARKDALHIIQSRPGDIERAFGWIDRFLQIREVTTALELCDAYEAVSGADVEIAMQRLMILEWLGDMDAIQAALEAALKAHPDETEFQMQQANWMMEQGQFAAALQRWEVLHEQDPENGFVALEYARWLTSLADHPDFRHNSQTMTAQAIDLLHVAMASESVKAEEKTEILVGYLMLSNLNPEWEKVASELIDLAATAHPNDEKFLQMKADLAYQMGDLQGTFNALEAALQVNPGEREVWRDAAAVSAELQDWQGMAQFGGQAIERFPLDAELHLLAAIGELQLDRASKALELLKRSVPLAAGNPELKARIQSHIGDAQHALGQDDLAAEAYEASLAIQPDEPFVLNNHAYHLAVQAKNLERALFCAQRANELMPDMPSFLDTEGWVLYQMGRHQEALIRIQLALEAGAMEDPEVWIHKGDICHALGQTEEAQLAYERAIEAGAPSDELLEKIESLQ